MDKPLVIYDGGCRFCCRWIERWRVTAGDRVDFETSEKASPKHPEIPPEAFQRAVQWVGETRCEGAEAVFRLMAKASWFGCVLLGLYKEVYAFARLSDAAYGAVARHREFFSFLTRMFWGNDVRPPVYALSSWFFLRTLGVIYLIAFLSYGAQIDGLLGVDGILPATRFFGQIHQVYGDGGFWSFPSLFIFGVSDSSLHGWCNVGVVASILVILGVAQWSCLVFLWAAYLSLVTAGQAFYGFQWDNLLLETGFFAIFLADFRLWSWKPAPPSGAARFLLVWLLFRLMVSSGLVKLFSGDTSWTDLTALEYHYFTQPLPTPLAWYMQQLPAWFQHFSAGVMFVVEIVFPFLLFAPRRLRLAAAGGIAVLQVLIALTGNYGFFNLLALALCALAVDDLVIMSVLRRPWRSQTVVSRDKSAVFQKWTMTAIAAVIFLLGLVPLLSSFRQPMPALAPIAQVYDKIEPFRTINAYGLFAVMTRERMEISIQGSDDGVTWKTYEFPYKPGDVRRAPPWVAPYMPRLDWQMWFAALGTMQDNPWFSNFLVKMLAGSRPVLGLLSGDPFNGHPPRYVRAMTDDYHFTGWEQGKKSGAWWSATPAGIYCPEAQLR